MPYKIIKKGEKFQLLNTNTNITVKKNYKSKQSAINAGNNFSNYRNEKQGINPLKPLNKKSIIKKNIYKK
tara:strand:- start:547 stop:756 length:210 start_codon:yes stop_codon:yes gene_type:complete